MGQVLNADAILTGFLGENILSILLLIIRCMLGMKLWLLVQILCFNRSPLV